MTEVWTGSWWRPDRWRTEEVGGELTASDRGNTLVLFGTFAEWDCGKDGRRVVTFPMAEPLREPMVHGFAGGTEFTLLNAECSFPRPPTGYGTEQWRAEAALEGHLVPSADGSLPLFRALRVSLQHLPVWARAQDVDQRFDIDRRRIEVGVEPHTLATAVLPSGATITIEQGVRTNNEGAVFAITQPVSLTIEIAEAITWTGLLNEWLLPVQVLLWLATARESWVESVEVRIETEDEHPTFARLRIPLLQPDPETAQNSLLLQDVLFFADELPSGFESGFSRWMEIWGNLRHVIGPLFARSRAPFVYADDRFSTAAAAIEAYHRFLADDERDLPRREHRGRVERLRGVLVDAAPDLADWAVNAATPFNRIPMWRRVVELIARAGTAGERLVGDHAVWFANEVEDARHGHAHARPARAGLTAEGGGLYLAAAGLVWLLRVNVLIDLGFEQESAVRRVVSNHNFQWVADELRTLVDRLSAEDSPGVNE